MAHLAAKEVINISIPPRVEPVNKISIYLAKKKKKRTPILINEEMKKKESSFSLIKLAHISEG